MDARVPTLRELWQTVETPSPLQRSKKKAEENGSGKSCATNTLEKVEEASLTPPIPSSASRIGRPNLQTSHQLDTRHSLSTLDLSRQRRSGSLTPDKDDVAHSRMSHEHGHSLLGAKSLILNALSARERKERRLTQQLEKIEAEIRLSNFGCRASSTSGLRRQSHDSVRPKLDQGNEPEHDFDDNATICSHDEESERIERLEKEHAELRQEHGNLQGEITKMTNQLSWIESQLEATKGHAETLSKSTSDWAGMLRQFSKAHSEQELRRTIRQGCIVLKHSANKRGCGTRFLAVDMMQGVIYWSKSMNGAVDIAKAIGQNSKDPTSAKGGIAQVETLSKDTSMCSLASVSAVLHGAQELSHFTSSGQNKATVPMENAERMMVVQTMGGKGPLVFEFFDAELADLFALGICLALAESTAQAENISKASNTLTSVVEGSRIRHHSPKSLTSKKEKTPARRLLNKYSSNETVGNPSTPERLKTQASELSSLLKPTSSVSSVKTLSSKASVRNLNPSFELKALDPNSKAQSFRATQLQRELAVVADKLTYQQVLIGDANNLSQMVMPLVSSHAQRSRSANGKQVRKDLVRERHVYVNAVAFPLGTQEKVDELISRLSSIIKETMMSNAESVEQDVVSYWCEEILLASSRTVIEGDVYGACHRLLTGPYEKVVLCPCSTTAPTPIELFVAPDGLVTIKSETTYRVVGVSVETDDRMETPEDWVLVRARCIEIMSLASQPSDDKNIRSLRLEFERP